MSDYIYYDMSPENMDVVIRSSIVKINETRRSRTGTQLSRNLMIAQVVRKAKQLIAIQEKLTPLETNTPLPIPMECCPTLESTPKDTSLVPTISPPAKTNSTVFDFSDVSSTTISATQSETMEVDTNSTTITPSIGSNLQLTSSNNSSHSAVRAQLVSNILKRCRNKDSVSPVNTSETKENTAPNESCPIAKKRSRTSPEKTTSNKSTKHISRSDTKGSNPVCKDSVRTQSSNSSTPNMIDFSQLFSLPGSNNIFVLASLHQFNDSKSDKNGPHCQQPALLLIPYDKLCIPDSVGSQELSMRSECYKSPSSNSALSVGLPLIPASS